MHWVIGGSLATRVSDGMFKVSVLNQAEWTLVESSSMVKDLIQLGLKNVIRVPNFKPIPKFIPKSQVSDTVSFVFFSRIMAEKGCRYILDSVASLNSQGLARKFSVDFYGKVDDSFKDEFFSRIERLQNVMYKGFLDVMKESGYVTLSEYDMMLFPTYWRGEGFAGVFIDAFIAGLPILASDWSCNKEILKEGETALFVPVHDVDSLTRVMKSCIVGEYDLEKMRVACWREASRYDVRNVVTQGLLHKIGIL